MNEARIGLKKTATGQPYTVRVQRQLADHTVIDASFIEPDDARCVERTSVLLDMLDARMIAVNEKIMGSTDRINQAVEAKFAEQRGMNGGTDGRSDRAAHVPADS